MEAVLQGAWWVVSLEGSSDDSLLEAVLKLGLWLFLSCIIALLKFKHRDPVVLYRKAMKLQS